MSKSIAIYDRPEIGIQRPHAVADPQEPAAVETLPLPAGQRRREGLRGDEPAADCPGGEDTLFHGAFNAEFAQFSLSSRSHFARSTVSYICL